MKYIIIKKSEATRDLLDLVNSEEEVLVLRVPTANVTAAETELATIEDKNWCASESKTFVEGDITDSILLPKEAINA